MPGPKLVKADKGTMVSTRVETEAPVEEPPRAPTATELSCWLRTASWAAWAGVATLEDAAAEVVVLVVAAAPLLTTKAPPAAALA